MRDKDYIDLDILSCFMLISANMLIPVFVLIVLVFGFFGATLVGTVIFLSMVALYATILFLLIKWSK